MLLKSIENICRSYVSNDCATEILHEIKNAQFKMKPEPNDIIVYNNGYEVKIGKVKRVAPNGAFVWYHSGDTAALTSFEHISPVQNAYNLSLASLGNEMPSTDALSKIIEYAYQLSRLVAPAVAHKNGMFLDGSVCDFLSDLYLALQDGRGVDIYQDEFYKEIYNRIAKVNQYYKD